MSRPQATTTYARKQCSSVSGSASDDALLGLARLRAMCLQQIVAWVYDKRYSDAGVCMQVEPYAMPAAHKGLLTLSRSLNKPHQS